MKLKLITAAAALLASAGAMATTTALGTVSVLTPTAFTGFAPPSAAFDDIFTFELPSNGGSGYSVVNFPLTIPSGDFNLIFSSMALFSNPDGILFNGDDALLTSAAGPGNLSFGWGPTTGGMMYLKVGGVSTGTLGGIYSGAVSVSAVPEPETLAMMLAGLGALGFLARRRKNG